MNAKLRNSTSKRLYIWWPSPVTVTPNEPINHLYREVTAPSWKAVCSQDFKNHIKPTQIVDQWGQWSLWTLLTVTLENALYYSAINPTHLLHCALWYSYEFFWQILKGWGTLRDTQMKSWWHCHRQLPSPSPHQTSLKAICCSSSPLYAVH